MGQSTSKTEKPAAQPVVDESGEPTTCAACGEALTDNYTSALGAYYHPEHFTCNECNEPLADKPFFAKNGRVFCEKDYSDKEADRCDACDLPIVGGKTYTAIGKLFHEDCFACSRCHAPCTAQDSQFFTELKFSIDGKQDEEDHGDGSHKSRLQLFCKECNQKDMKSNPEVYTCRWCDEIVEGSGITAADSRWHPECFVCHNCNTSLFESGQFFVVNNKIFCRNENCVFARTKAEELDAQAASTQKRGGKRTFFGFGGGDTDGPKRKSPKTKA